MVAHPPYLFNRSVAYNIAYGMKLRGMPKYVTRERTRELLKMVGLEGFEKKDARKLSSGQQQRVVLARSLALEPEVLLLDEPTASIDRKHSEELESLIAQLSRQKGMTVLFSTHNYHQAVLLAERIISLYDGRVEPFAYENLFGGTIYTDGETSRIQVSEVVTLSLVSESSGQAHISIDPRDITLSREPVLSPQMNCCLGKLKSMAIHDSHVKLIVDIGVSLTSIMRQDSLRQLGLTLGEEVYCIFKPDAVKTI
jgi:tungstate transport system ATP-binding protein